LRELLSKFNARSGVSFFCKFLESDDSYIMSQTVLTDFIKHTCSWRAEYMNRTV